MKTERGRAWIGIALALTLLLPIAAPAADAPVAQGKLEPNAVSFVQTLAKGDFKAAEADFTDQMKQAAPPEELGETWQKLVGQLGPFQSTGGSKTVVRGGYTTVIVRTDFKSRALGIAVSFDSAQKIAGVHFVPPP